MSDTSGPYRVSVQAEIWVSDPARLGGEAEQRLPDLLAALIRTHAWEGGLEIIDPESVRVAPRCSQARSCSVTW